MHRGVAQQSLQVSGLDSQESKSVICFMMSIPCLTMAGVCAASLKGGSRDVIAGSLGIDCCRFAKKADHYINE